MKKTILLLTLLALGYNSLTYAEQAILSQGSDSLVSNDNLAAMDNIPTRHVMMPFSDIITGPMVLKGTNPDRSINFNVRGDEIISDALLNLEFTPSPALTPSESHLKVYLNEELIDTIAITSAMLGKKNQVQLSLDPRYFIDLNKINFNFVGNYASQCANMGNPVLWFDISKSSNLALTYQSLSLQNDLARFPAPFFDQRDNQPLNLPVTFAGQPTIEQQHAAAILASWFGTQAKWRGQTFPVLYNQLPDRHGVVFATNNQRPSFLNDHPAVNGPTIAMINHPSNPYIKLLVIMGRDDADLITAVKGIAQANIIFRGSIVQVENIKQLAPRQPYDAPNWVRMDKPMMFSELLDYSGQLQSTGIDPSPITLNLNLPPDLYLSSPKGIDMKIKYRYTSPQSRDGSRLDISLNDAFIESYSLAPQSEESSQLLRIPLLQSLLDSDNEITIPMFKLGSTNQLRFNFDYSNVVILGSADRCEFHQMPPNFSAIDENSTIDFSGYSHFMAMPDLRAFANASFPFSRMADLSETLLVMNKNPHPAQISVLLDTMGQFGSQIGYPSLQVRITDDWQQVKQTDADLLLIGSIPKELATSDKINVLISQTESSVQMPGQPSNILNSLDAERTNLPESQTSISAEGAMATLLGFESPFYPQRSVVVILADSPQGYQLYNNTLINNEKRATIFGSTAIIRNSGITSLRVGDTYYVGHIPWWQKVWYMLGTHPVVLALLAVFSVILSALVLWRILRYLSSRRLSSGQAI